MDSDLTRKIKTFVFENVADLTGTASSKNLEDAVVGQRPSDILPDARSVIVIGMEVQRSVVETNNWHIYSNQYLTINNLLNALAYKVSKYIDKRGFSSIPIPTSGFVDEKKLLGDFSHKYAAVEAGLGEIGISGLLLTPEFGPRVRLASIITNAPLVPDKKIEKRFFDCKKCLKCVVACPIKAIGEGGSFDKYSCRERHEKLKKTGLRCPICIKVCPVGR